MVYCINYSKDFNNFNYNFNHICKTSTQLVDLLAAHIKKIMCCLNMAKNEGQNMLEE